MLSQGACTAGSLFLLRAIFVGILAIDKAYFQAHPAVWEYRRAPLADEWTSLVMPARASVHVYLVTCHCVVRGLEGPRGERLATVIDIERDTAIISGAGADELPAWKSGLG
jgi:hypothetical protein